MSGLVDLLFLGLILWLVLRAVGKAAGEVRGRDGGGEEVGAGAREGTERRDAGEDHVRRRLMEELRRWEADQRPATQGVEVRRSPGGLARAEPRRDLRAEADLRPEAESLETSPRVEAVSLEEGPTAEVTRRREIPASATLSADVTLRGRRGAGARRPGGGLPDLSRYGPVRRAVVWAEILGTPSGLRDPASGTSPLPGLLALQPPSAPSPPSGTGRDRGGAATPRL